MYLFKNYDLKDWVSFCEVYGMPLRLGTYDATASEKDKACPDGCHRKDGDGCRGYRAVRD
ncbi:MAG: DUF935 family protein [Enterocloster sp.]